MIPLRPSRIKLSENDIYEKEFKTAMRGYNQVEVDEFLDVVIQDYQVFMQEIEKLQNEIERLKKTSETRPRSPKQNQQVNYDILKRLSNLEKEVFGKKFADSVD